MEQNNQPMTEDQIRAMRGDLGSGLPPHEPSLNIPSQQGKPIFDADEPAFSPNTANQLPQSVDELIAADGGGKKKMWWILGGVTGVIILGAVGYFAIAPLLNKKVPPAPTAPDTANTQPVTPTPPVTPTQPTPASAFVNEPDRETTVSLPDPVSRSAIMGAFVAQGQTITNGVVEINFTDSSGDSLASIKALEAILPAFNEAAGTANLFTEDLTAYALKDQKGLWPGFVLTLKEGFSADSVRAWFTALEKAPIANFFTVTPGSLAAFKAGTVNGKYADRYASGSTPGASFSYLMLPQQKQVIISTSFEGIKAAIRLMGL